METLSAFLESPSGLAVKALLVAALVVFVLGVLAALRDGTFAWAYVDSFVRTTIWGRVAPVLFLLLLGYFADEQSLTAVGVLVGGTVAAGMIQAALASVRQLTMTREASAEANGPPQG